jgi:hypothetical protein
MIPSQTVTCGYCEEPLLLDEDSHYCEDRQWHEDYLASLNHQPFHYSATAVAEGQQFLIDHPEFIDYGTNPYTSHRRIGAYSSIEEDDYLTPLNYDQHNLPILSDGFPELTREDEWDSIYAQRDQYQREFLTYWKDVEPARCTSVKYWWSNHPKAPGWPTPYQKHHVPNIKVRGQLTLFTTDASYDQRYHEFDYEQRDREGVSLTTKLAFDELQGFASEQLLDFGITEKYQYKLFNVYAGHDKHLHCGLLTINQEAQQVTCSRGDCHYRKNPLNIPNTTDRSVQEQFVHAIIRHGNNHGPDFYLKRQDFAFIHRLNCDANHKRTEACNTNRPVAKATTENLSGAIASLIRHRKFCNHNQCRCTAYYHALSHQERQLSVA